MVDMQTADVVQTVVIGTGTGDGGPSKLIGTTRGDRPDIVAQVIGPIAAVLIRFVKNFLVGLSSFTGLSTFASGFLTEQTTADSVVAVLQQLDLHMAVMLALVPALGGVIKDLITIFSGLEQKYPLASV